MAIDGGFWRYKKHLRTFWNQGRCMVHSDAIWNDVLEIGTAVNFFWNQGPCMVHSDAIRNDVHEVETAETILKARTQNGAFWRYLKQILGSWNCWENVESKEKVSAFWFYLKRCLGSWNCLEHFETKEAKWCIRTLFKGCGPTTFRGAIACRNNYVHH